MKRGILPVLLVLLLATVVAHVDYEVAKETSSSSFLKLEGPSFPEEVAGVSARVAALEEENPNGSSGGGTGDTKRRAAWQQQQQQGSNGSRHQIRLLKGSEGRGGILYAVEEVWAANAVGTGSSSSSSMLKNNNNKNAKVETDCVKNWRRRRNRRGSKSSKSRSSSKSKPSKSKSGKGSKSGSGSSDEDECEEDENSTAAEVSVSLEYPPCTAVALERIVTNLPSTTFRMELGLVMRTSIFSSAKNVEADLRKALQLRLAASLTNCNQLEDRRKRRRMQRAASNVVFGPIQVTSTRKFRWNDGGC